VRVDALFQKSNGQRQDAAAVTPVAACAAICSNSAGSLITPAVVAVV
jgi:hypothetical protein